ncbi:MULTISPECIES: DUF5658 family protein [Salinibaculum]|uniref:DUF5658 family protein n=1 Tax=Salinibaculum TaxID=2732368 RepID=UPI0030D4446E
MSTGEIGGRVAALEGHVPGYTGFVYALVAVWGLGDLLSTYVAVAAVGDAAMEANPWIRVLLETEPLLVLALKAAVVLYAGVVLLECRPVVECVPGWRLWFGGVVAAGWLVVVNNLAIGFAALV